MKVAAAGFWLMPKFWQAHTEALWSPAPALGTTSQTLRASQARIIPSLVLSLMLFRKLKMWDPPVPFASSADGGFPKEGPALSPSSALALAPATAMYLVTMAMW